MGRVVATVVCCCLMMASSGARASSDDATAVDILRELIAINTTDAGGSVTDASRALADRFRRAGLPSDDIHLVGPTAQTQSLVIRLRGGEASRPILFIGHLDVVEAPRVDWATDPFELVERDGYFYGRGTLDMKGPAAAMVAALLHLIEEHYLPDRDVIVALTSGEESFKNDGVKWLIDRHRELVDASFVINLDGVGVLADHGRPSLIALGAAEKLYADFRLFVINPGGSTSLPGTDNAIYTLASALGRLAAYRFPTELNPVTRAYFESVLPSLPESRRNAVRALLDAQSDQPLNDINLDRLDNALTRTVCSPSRLRAGHANNALPQFAEAIVNCRILPGHSAEEVQQVLIRVIQEPLVRVHYVREVDGLETEAAPASVAMPAASPNREVSNALAYVAGRMWPNVPIVTSMSVGESDAVWTRGAGLPTYMVNGLVVDRDDIRVHGKDERIRVGAFRDCVAFEYNFVKALTSPRSPQ